MRRVPQKLKAGTEDMDRRKRYKVIRFREGRCANCAATRGLSLFARLCTPCGESRKKAQRKKRGGHAWKPGKPGRPPLSHIKKRSTNAEEKAGQIEKAQARRRHWTCFTHNLVSTSLFVAVVVRADGYASKREDGDWACFTHTDRDGAIRRALAAVHKWESKPSGTKYLVWVGTLTQSVTEMFELKSLDVPRVPMNGIAEQAGQAFLAHGPGSRALQPW